MAKRLRALNAMTQFRLSEREPLNNSESDMIVTVKTLCLKGHSCRSEQKVVEEYKTKRCKINQKEKVQQRDDKGLWCDSFY